MVGTENVSWVEQRFGARVAGHGWLFMIHVVQRNGDRMITITVDRIFGAKLDIA